MSWTSHLITILVVTVFAQIVLSAPAPQFLTFQDGKFGVNFGGYHAEAGLGGLLTGNAAHGGLSASAGTPYGQQAGAGIGGIASGNERTAGGAYAGATAGHGVGASAAIGGGLAGEGGAGGVGAEAHAAGVSKKVVRLGQTNGADAPSEAVFESETAPAKSPSVSTRFNQENDGKSKTKTKTYVKEVNTDISAHHPVHTRTKTFYKKKIISRPHKVATDDNFNGHHGIQSETHVYNNGFDLNRFFDFQTFSNLAATYAHPPVQTSISSVATTSHVEHKGHTANTELTKEVSEDDKNNDNEFQPPNKTSVTSIATTSHGKGKDQKPNTELNKEVSKDEQNNGNGVQPPNKTSVTSIATSSRGKDKDQKPNTELNKEVHLNNRQDTNGQSSGSSQTTTTITGSSSHGTNFWNDIFNIPIATLSAVNQFLNNKSGSGTVQVHKHTEIVHGTA
ncbi:merozoite surface protein 2 isoform X7 [Uranotaenia lowii]|uniref:merozoite surface protein 2 isoform X7 n=1 Tax=Uranotaenia lowii TaxID=190385 RepID=UPI0024785FB3|nr:merozoite surface protein 2 isoform X7 [Uranotaenia lowii]